MVTFQPGKGAGLGMWLIKLIWKVRGSFDLQSHVEHIDITSLDFSVEFNILLADLFTVFILLRWLYAGNQPGMKSSLLNSTGKD